MPSPSWLLNMLLIRKETVTDREIVVSRMGILPQVDHNCNATLNKVKIPDYAKDYKNEYLFIRGINIRGIMRYLKKHKVEKIKRLIERFDKAQKLGYLKDISDKDIWGYDVYISFLTFG